MVIQSRIRIPDHFSTSLTIAVEGVFGDLLLAFIIQSPADFYDTRRQDESTFCERSGTDRQTPGSESGLIRKYVFEFRIIFGWDFGLGGGLHSLNAL